MTTRSFDLNIEEVLEDWEVQHAIREIISNALDEQLITNTADIQITKDQDGRWHICDAGRGLRIDNFTLNENREKLDATTGIIGKFGVGLKDALATFHRRGVEVQIRSRFGLFWLKEEPKHGFDAISTLHVEYDDSPNEMVGTDFTLTGATDADVAKAKALFLKFSGEQVLETTTYGQILGRGAGAARVYILGVLASEEPNFLFSYNVASLTEAMKKRLNRERLNVGRTTYAERVKAILRGATSDQVSAALVNQVHARAAGTQCDEMAWIEISQKALNLLNAKQRVAYLTEEEVRTRPEILDNVQRDGLQVVVVSDQQKAKLVTQMKEGGPEVRTLDVYVQQYNTSFQYQFVSPEELSSAEGNVLGRTQEILALIGLRGAGVPRIVISETMRLTNDNTEGVWDAGIAAIVIRRSKLATLAGYAGTLLHEVGHATTGAVDATREFEAVLTGYLGRTATKALAV